MMHAHGSARAVAERAATWEDIMDYMAELAEHPDMYAAPVAVKGELGCSLSDERDSPCGFLHQLVGAAPENDNAVAHSDSPKRDLHTQQPHAWITEVIHAFYARPQLAARAWKQLRY
jgi:hypothetical protein